MFRPTARALLRSYSSRQLLRSPAQRSISFNPPPSYKPKTWKSSALRWGLAIGGIYWYNTSPLFQANDLDTTIAPIYDTREEDENLPSLESYLTSRAQKRAAMTAPSTDVKSGLVSSLPPSSNTPVHQHQSTAASPPAVVPAEPFPAETASGSPADLEEEAEGEGAFNPETGEINWDCPCLGGMAHGPCGMEFREAFSCFVFSQEDPKGIDCIDRFRNMQDCFRKYPDVYGAELAEDPSEEDAASGGLDGPAPASASTSPQADDASTATPSYSSSVQSSPASSAPSSPQQSPAPSPQPGSLTSGPSSGAYQTPSTKVSAVSQDTLEDAQAKRDRAEAAKAQVERDFGGGDDKSGIPQAAYDARDQTGSENKSE